MGSTSVVLDRIIDSLVVRKVLSMITRSSRPSSFLNSRSVRVESSLGSDDRNLLDDKGHCHLCEEMVGAHAPGCVHLILLFICQSDAPDLTIFVCLHLLDLIVLDGRGDCEDFL